jgi:hypothetical protein
MGAEIIAVAMPLAAFIAIKWFFSGIVQRDIERTTGAKVSRYSAMLLHTKITNENKLTALQIQKARNDLYGLNK